MKSAMRNHIIYFVILVSIILIFGSIEYYLRNKNIKVDNAPYKISLYTHDGRPWLAPRNWWANPNTLKLAVAPYTIYKNAPDQKTPYFTTNSKGFRGSKEFSNFSKKDKRIVVVGGSAAFGHGLSNDNETFQVQMEKLNSKYEVINAGVGGFHSGQELTYIVTELVDYHPNMIIAFDGWNDLFWDWYVDRYSKRILKDTEIGFNQTFVHSMEDTLVYSYQQQTSVRKSFQRFFNNVIGRSILLSKIRESIVKLPHNSNSDRTSNNKISGKNKNEYFEKILDVYTKNLIKMHDFCNSQGIKFLVVFQPEISLKSKMTVEERNHVIWWSHVWNVDNYMEEYSPLYKRFITRSKAILTKKGVRFIDVNDQPEYKNNPNTLFRDFVHPNKEGNKIIAYLINEHIK